MANFTDPIKAAFGRYLGRFYSEHLVADTPALAEFRQRGFAKSAVWAPGRMVDQVEEMLSSWRKNDNDDSDTPHPKLPVMIAAMSKDYMPAPADYGRQMLNPVDVIIPGDPKHRVFKMRAVTADIRAQVAICAPEDPTARSIAMQLQMFSGATENRRFHSIFRLAGMDDHWPVVLETPDIQAINTPAGEAKNLTILTVDFQLRATVPLLQAPASGGDGQGSGTEDDPDGYLVVVQALGANAPRAGYVHEEDWSRP